MSIYFSASINAFYDTDFTKNIPSDAIQISSEYHKELIIKTIISKCFGDAGYYIISKSASAISYMDNSGTVKVIG